MFYSLKLDEFISVDLDVFELLYKKKSGHASFIKYIKLNDKVNMQCLNVLDPNLKTIQKVFNFIKNAVNYEVVKKS